MNKDAIESLIYLVKNSQFYNKFQILSDISETGHSTETFYFYENKWGHMVVRENSDGSTETYGDMETLENDDLLVQKLTSINKELSIKVFITSNSGEWSLSVTI